MIKKLNIPRHRFDQRSWNLIKIFVGIYGIKLDYSAISKLHEGDIYDAVKWSRTSSYMMPIEYLKTRHYGTTLKNIILKNIAKIWKNRQLYEELETKLESNKKNYT